MLADRLAVAASAEVTYRRNDLVYLASHQQVALVCAPARTCLGTPVFAQCGDLAKALHRVIEVEFIPVKSSVTKGSGAPGSCVGHSTVPSPHHGRLLSTGGCGLSQCDSASRYC